MTNAELLAKIKAEIKRRIEHHKEWVEFYKSRGTKSDYDETILGAYSDLLSFLSTLESEKPVPADLEKAARKSAITPFNLDIDEEHLDEYPYLPIAEQKFIEGAKWQAEQDQETIELAEDHAYLAGAVNERKKVLEEAVEGEVRNIIIHENGDEVHYSITYPKGKSQHSINDKVKIIIL